MASFTPGWDAVPPLLLHFWTERHLCVLTSVRADGRPHAVPVGVALDPDQGCAWVITGAGSHKARLLAAAGPGGAPVAACQVDGARWSSLEGIGVVHRDADSVARAVERYAGRYRQPRVNPERVAIRITDARFLASASLLDGNT